MMPCVILLEAEERPITDEEWAILVIEVVRVRKLLERLQAVLGEDW
jgi:hypothetical protein